MSQQTQEALEAAIQAHILGELGDQVLALGGWVVQTEVIGTDGQPKVVTYLGPGLSPRVMTGFGNTMNVMALKFAAGEDPGVQHGPDCQCGTEDTSEDTSA